MTDALDASKLDGLTQDLGDPDVVVELIGVYLEEADKLLEKAETAVSDDDAEKLSEAGHTLKSSSRQLGVEAVADLALELEEAGQDGDLDAAPGLVEEARGAYEEAAKELRDWRDQAAG